MEGQALVGQAESAGPQAQDRTVEQGEALQHHCPSDQVTSCAEGSESHSRPEASSSSPGYKGSQAS